jgi:glycosyltransferase involved in cell wall biosynthesis
VRIAFLPDGASANAMYRSIAPMAALARRGDDVRQLDLANVREWHGLLDWCELLHVHRVCDDGAVELVRAAKAAGATVVWDDDDDTARPPKGMSGKGVASGRKGAARLAARAKLFEVVDLVTAPSRFLAETFRREGARRVGVIENYVIDEVLRDRLPRQGITIGWVAGVEHGFDLQHLPIASALEALLDAHPDLRVTTIGLRLGLGSDRYAHLPPIPLQDLLRQVSAFDVGIAPLSPAVPMSHWRSNIKVKEYAAVGVPWLASPIGPYEGLGEKQGGRLVPDDRWREELDALIRDERARRKLAKRALRWGRDQLLSRNVSRFRHAFAEALAADGGRKSRTVDAVRG